MKNYTYQNTLVSKKQLKQILAWSFTKYGSVEACFLADELKYLGFKYATQAGISISIEDLRVPYVKNSMLVKANKEITNAKKICLKGQITDIERFQKIIETWNITSESLKDEVVSYFKKYDPLNSVYMMAFSGARGNLSQVRQLVGMRGLMSDPSGQIMNLPIKKNFREGLTITDYLMSGYGARKGIVDTALKTANSGYLTRRLIDVAQDIIIREKDCLTPYSFLFTNLDRKNDSNNSFSNQLLGRLVNKRIYDPDTKKLIADINTQITPNLIRTFKERNINNVYIRSPLTCRLYRSICQKCYGWNLAKENIVDLGEAVGIIAGQSIGEPGTQLTMRTFHTGGIFTSAASQQLISPINGIIEFSKFLKTSTVRTNRGENVLLTENSGFLTILSSAESNFQMELPRNTILFIKNNQYIKTNTIVGQLAGSLKQTLTETKLLLSNMSGEVFMPRINRKGNSITINKLLWLLSGQVYQAPKNSFLNFYNDYKINKNNYIFRSKIINLEPGYIQISNSSTSPFQQIIKVVNISQIFQNSTINKFYRTENKLNYLLNYHNLVYCVNFNNQSFLIRKSTNLPIKFATLITNQFKTLTGGITYYTEEINRTQNYQAKLEIHFYEHIKRINHQSIIWLAEETYLTNCDNRFLLVVNNNFIPEKFEIISDHFSKMSGLVKIIEKKNIVQEITIQSGSLYEVVNLKNTEEFMNQVFYPGELLLDRIEITQPSFVEVIDTDLSIQLLIRPLEIYETPLEKSIEKNFGRDLKKNSLIEINNRINYPYKSNQKIKQNHSLDLITDCLNLTIRNCFNKTSQLRLDIKVDSNNELVKLITSEELFLTQYIPANLKYTDIKLSLIVKNNQFVNSYSKLGYLQIVTNKLLQIVKLKSKNAQKKQIFLISNDDCIILSKNKVKDKTINQLLINPLDISETGKIIIDNGKIVTIQKGRPYFFPNCKNDSFVDETILQYKLVSPYVEAIKEQFNYRNSINIHYYDITNKLISIPIRKNKNIQFAFSKMIIKKQGKFYSSGVPIFLRELLISRKKNNSNLLSNLKQIPLKNDIEVGNYPLINNSKHLLFVQKTDLKFNEIKSIENSRTDFASLLLLEYPIPQMAIHSVTEDFLEKEVNSVYCKNGEFIENGQTIGLLNFEKEITGDIIQGLPRIEELLEARKKKKLSKRISKNQKKSLLIRKTSLDPSFEFRKLGTTIKNNEKINPHNLLKIYFNYYAKSKTFISHNQLSQLFRLTNSYEASYRSFKKVQLLILSSVQSVYKSQAVTIADKHLEIIIKQMTSKVQITRAGDTPLLPHEVIDLYHIKYINQVVTFENCQSADYVPLLLGVTKAALNNPSFISAASFQETTRVLTKAAIEGRRDWLRGLKENIVIGQLIPAGTGCKIYSTLFEKNSNPVERSLLNSSTLKTF
jgi:DNA-directed RNA polymerase subunit beta'